MSNDERRGYDPDDQPCCGLHIPFLCESDEPGMDGPCCENCPSWPPAD